MYAVSRPCQLCNLPPMKTNTRYWKRQGQLGRVWVCSSSDEAGRSGSSIRIMKTRYGYVLIQNYRHAMTTRTEIKRVRGTQLRKPASLLLCFTDRGRYLADGGARIILRTAPFLPAVRLVPRGGHGQRDSRLVPRVEEWHAHTPLME